MKQNFTIEVSAENNFSVLNRIVNILNRRRVRIKKMMAFENENNFRKGSVILLLHSTEDMIEKVSNQFEKLIEVEKVFSSKGETLYIELSERMIDTD